MVPNSLAAYSTPDTARNHSDVQEVRMLCVYGETNSHQRAEGKRPRHPT